FGAFPNAPRSAIRSRNPQRHLSAALGVLEPGRSAFSAARQRVRQTRFLLRLSGLAHHRATSRGLTMTLTEKLDELAEQSQWDLSDLRALFFNCTLKKSPEPSNTQGLADLAISIMERNGVR